ncbi:MAG TPA: Franean1_4349 family RiPP [Candidatus Methylomirabilis sp.]|nr:Franean1_4349 family RiPP [Candidatus Methylomirabilis sp.]
MSQRAVERTLGKLVTDEGFRDEFFMHPQTTCVQAGLNLTQEELDALSRLPRTALAALCARLDDRICRLHVAIDPAHEEHRR